MEFGLSETICATIRQIPGQHPQIEKAVIYGSRAKGNFKNGSDIDLTLMGDALDYKVLSEVAWALDESSIPHTVDLSLVWKNRKSRIARAYRACGCGVLSQG